jgi:hypothetical protein
MATPQIVGSSPKTFPFVGEGRMKAQSRENKSFRPMTMAEINERIDRSLEDFSAGRTISQEDLEKEILTWR